MIVTLKNFQLKKIFYMFYIEPIVFTLVFAHNLSATILKDQVIFQTCTTIFNYNVSDCRQLGTRSTSSYINTIETEVQPYVANFFMVRTLLESIVPAVCGIFIGSWSDHYGRKPLLIISMIGFSFTYIICAIISQISTKYSVNPWYYIIAVMPHSILGGNCVFSVAAFCFISDITSTKSRPYRMISVEGSFFIGLMSGALISSFVYAATNATITFIISGLIMCSSTIFIIVCVPESLHFQNRNHSKEEEEHKPSTTELEEKPERKPTNEMVIKHNEKSVEEVENSRREINEKEEVLKNEKVAGLFNYVHIKNMLTTCFKQRPYHDRFIIWLITGVMFILLFVFDGAITVLYLFTREKFHWSVRDYTLYESVSHLVPMLGAVIGFLLLHKLFRMSVVTLAILALFSHVLASIVRGVAAQDWHMYLSVVLSVFSAISGPMCRTIVSNIVPPTDLGKIFSIKNILQSVAPFVAAPLYAFIYKRSLATFPGLFNIVSAVLYSMALSFLCIVLYFKHAYKEHYGSIL